MEDNLPIPTQRTVVYKFCGIPIWSRTTIQVVNFDIENYYKKLSDRMAKELSEEIKKGFNKA